MLSILTPRPFPDLALLREGQGGWGCLNKNSTKKQLQCCEEWDLSVICCLKPRRLQVWGRLEFWACSAVWEKQWEGKHHPLWGNYWNYQRPAPVLANDNPAPLPCLPPCNWYTQFHSLRTCQQCELWIWTCIFFTLFIFGFLSTLSWCFWSLKGNITDGWV